jgi:NAD(P)-dependent dehydrogenase (short-subunit alcohol dehydrogenase family)
VTVKLANDLAQKGSTVVVLSFPLPIVPNRLSLPEGVVRVELSDLSEVHLQQQLAILMKTYGSIDTFIHLHPRSPISADHKLSCSQIDQVILQQVFLLAKYLKQPLMAAARTCRSCFLSVAWLDGTFGLNQNSNFSVVAAGLFGLTKSLAHEWPTVFCRVIDFSPELSTDQVVLALLTELYDPNLAIAEVGYSPIGRTTLTC